jgi:hypothetical protein
MRFLLAGQSGRKAENEVLKAIERTTNLHSFRVSLEDAQKIFDRLLEIVKEQGEGEVASLRKPDDKTDDEFAADKANILETAFRVTVTIAGEDGDALFGDSRDVFTSANLPERIAHIYMTNVTAYQGFAGVRPGHRFELMLDFSKPPLLDDKNFVSSPTPNNSHLNVAGSKDSWVASISDTILRTVTKRKNMRSWLHRGFSYDYGLFILALPFAFYICWLIYPLLGRALENVHPDIRRILRLRCPNDVVRVPNSLRICEMGLPSR